MTLPSHAQIVVIGGGIIGCSTAYHLARDHKADVVLLETGQADLRLDLARGGAGRAIALVGVDHPRAQIFGRSLQAARCGDRPCDRLEDDRLPAARHQPGPLDRVPPAGDDGEKFRHGHAAALARRGQGDVAADGRVDDLVGASWLPTDGQASPSDITQSLAKGARMHGAKLFEDVRVTGFEMKDGRIVKVKTDQGDIACEKVVNCAGQWARQVGAMAGINVPLQPVKHQYIITEKIDGLATDAPTIRDPDRRTYFKEEVGGLVMGGYEPNPQAWIRLRATCRTTGSSACSTTISIISSSI